MWVRKTKLELDLERSARKEKFEKYIIGIIALAIIWAYFNIGSIDNLVSMYKNDPEGILVILLLPLLVYFGYRNYVIHGSAITERPGKVCLGCGIGLGFSDDGWGFKSYGKHKKEWYQIKACKTSEKCDIAYQCEVKWVEGNDKNA